MIFALGKRVPCSQANAGMIVSHLCKERRGLENARCAHTGAVFRHGVGLGLGQE